MKSKEIKELLEIKNYLIEMQDYYRIIWNSPQINKINYNKEKDSFFISTDDKCEFNFKVKKKEK